MSGKKQGSTSKRQELRDKRQKRARQQRLALIVGTGGVIVLLALLVVVPQVQRANQPVGTIVPITPQAYPDANGTAMGNPNAPVKVVVYEDFQCPSCQLYTEQVEPLLIQNEIKSGQVYYEFRNFPIIDQSSITKESHQAANAALCAADQGKFWEYHDILFKNQEGENVGSFTDKRLQAFAQLLGLNMSEFNACFSADKHQNQVNAEFQEGQKAGVTGTPSVFVNGTEVTPGYIPSYDQLKQAIQQALGTPGTPAATPGS
jgi:protein-disulfide isomerase